MKKKKILIHSIAFSPDGVSTAYIYNDIALGFKNHGYEVVVLTTTPHYNVLPDEIVKQPLKKVAFGLYYKSEFREIRVYHVPQKKFKQFIWRAVGFVYWHFLSLILGLAQKNISLILSPSPPLTIGFVSIIIAKLKRAKVIYNVQEIYPDFLINKGNLRSGPLLKILSGLEKFVYNYSDRVTTIDKVFYETIVNRFKNPSKLIVIPNFVDTDIYQRISPENLKLDRVLFPNTTALKVMYAGNIGHAQDWEPLLRVAKMLKEYPVEFWVIGEGVVKDTLKKEIESNNLVNIHLLPYQPRQLMADIISYADIHFIFMNPQMDGQGFPSKVYTIMACKKPLLITSGTNTPLYNFLYKKDCAFLINQTDIIDKCNDIASVLKKLIINNDIIDEYGTTAYEIIRGKYSKDAVINQYIDLCENLLAGKSLH